jgi:hypothetical protein
MMKVIGYQPLRKLECAEMNHGSGLPLCPALSTESKQELVEDCRTFDSVIWNSTPWLQTLQAVKLQLKA